MGTLITSVISGDVPQAVTTEVCGLLRSLEERLTVNGPPSARIKSQVNAINECSGITAVTADSEVYRIVRKAVTASREYRNSFNALIGPVVKSWGIGFDSPRLPSDAEISELLTLTDPFEVELNDEASTVKLLKKGMQLDLGAIAKGYAADLAAKVYNNHGVNQGLIDLGGNVLAMGGSDRAADGLWRIGIQSPFKPRGTSLGTLALRDCSAVTSGIYERSFEKDGKHYHHMINPATGYPFETDIASVTVIAATSTIADLWTTILQSGGLAQSHYKAENESGIEAVFVTKERLVLPTSGIRDVFTHTDNDYKLISHP